jgi:rhodanese-related sulfurtransferase
MCEDAKHDTCSVLVDRTASTSSAIAQRLQEARSRLKRVLVSEILHFVSLGAVIVDVRPEYQRYAEDGGEIANSLVVCRSVLEWRLDPTSPSKLPFVDERWYHKKIILICREGYSSGLAAESLQRIGLLGATDLCGGFKAWKAGGLEVVPAGTLRVYGSLDLSSYGHCCTEQTPTTC